MGTKNEPKFCYHLNGSIKKDHTIQLLMGKLISCLPTRIVFRVYPTLKHVKLLFLLLTLFHCIPDTNSQPLLNQLAVLLRARPPWPTSFPATAPSQQESSNLQQQQQQQQQQQPQLLQQHQTSSNLQQQIQAQSNHVYPTSSEQLQNFIASNNFAQGHLSQGIPVVAMDPSQNSITIMTPTGPGQILAPSPSAMGGGGVFVAQPIQQNENIPIPSIDGNNNTNNNGPIITHVNNNAQNNNLNGNNNHSPPGTIVQVMPPAFTFDSQNLIDGSMFAAAGLTPQIPPSGSANNAVVAIPANFINEQNNFQPNQHQQPQQQFQPNQQQQFQPGFFMHGPISQGHEFSNPVPLNHQQVAPSVQPPPVLPPIPKKFKGPAIIAVPKQVPPSKSPILLSSPSFLGPAETFHHHHFGKSPSGGSSGPGSQPIIIHSFHELPNLTPAFPQHMPQHPGQSYHNEHMISLPENAMVNMELNKTNFIYSENQQPHYFSSNFQPSQQDHQIEIQQQPQQQVQQPSQPENPQLAQSQKPSSTAAPHTELSSEIVGNPRNQRKRHQRIRTRQPMQFHKQLQQYEQHTTRGMFKIKPTARPTQIPLPSESENIQNEIDNRSTASLDYSLSTMINMPSSTITGSFEYPDPPTPPNFESMNTLKYPSPFEDSAEVSVKSRPEILSSSSSSTSSSRERKRVRGLQERLKSSLHLHNSPYGSRERKRAGIATRKTTTQGTTTGSDSPSTAAEASSIYNSITTTAMLPKSNMFEIDPHFRDTTTFIPSSTITTSTQAKKKSKGRRKGKSNKAVKKDFRPSPQIHSFEEPVTGIKSYITILPPVTTFSQSDESKSGETSARQRGKKSLFAKFEANESKHPPYQAGFKPVSHYTTYAVGKGSNIPAASTTTESLYFDLIRETVSKSPPKSWSEPDLNILGENRRENRKLVSPTDRYSVTAVTSNGNTNSNYGYTTLSSTLSTDTFTKAGWKVKDHLISGDEERRQLTTSASSERVEDWRFPDTTNGSSKIYFGNGKFGPPNCDKFHRFGFCPMNSGYPSDQVEKIASRCSALLSHLIAPLPKADVRYDVIVSKNGSMLKGRSVAPSGWSWKSFSGKPVCDTKEIKVVPGWAKNEQGEWLVILQTKAWKQEAQITLCTPQGTHYNCKGNKTSGNKSNKDCIPIKIKCVQRFTAQRLVVLDSNDPINCPVVRSVFLPSACVCLHDGSSRKPSSISSLSSSEEITGSSSNVNIKISSKSNKGKKGSTPKKSSKKSSSSKKNKKSSSRNARKSKGNTATTISSSEEQENKSDMLDTAADSSTSGNKASGHGHTSESLVEKEQVNQEEDSPEDDEDNDVDERPHAEHLISTANPSEPTGTGEDTEDEQSNQNEEENDDNDEENTVDDSSNEQKNNTTTDSHYKSFDESVGRVTTTITSNSHGGIGTGVDETSDSEEHFEEKKA